MPEITNFYGIAIKLFFGDHPPPHFRALYGDKVGMFSLDTLTLIEGELPPRAQKMVVEWAKEHKSELKIMWTKQDFRKLPPLE